MNIKNNLFSYTLACFKKPKSQVWISYPLNLVHISILIGFAKKIKILAVREVRPNCTWSFVEKYKGLKKFIKGNFFRHIFSFFYIAKNFNKKTKHMALILRSRPFFRHQDPSNSNMSYFDVIWVISDIVAVLQVRNSRWPVCARHEAVSRTIYTIAVRPTLYLILHTWWPWIHYFAETYSNM